MEEKKDINKIIKNVRATLGIEALEPSDEAIRKIKELCILEERILLQRIEQLEKDPKSAIPWKEAKRTR